MIKAILGAATLMGVLTITNVSEASHRHIDELAVNLEQHVRRLESESVHFRHTQEYYHLKRDLADMRKLASHIHTVAHQNGSPYHLQSDLEKLDRLFHHVENLIEDIEHGAGHQHSRYSGGHIHGDTRHVRRVLRDVGATLHHLHDDIDDLVDDRSDHHRGHDERHYGRPGFGPRIGGGLRGGGIQDLRRPTGITFGNGLFQFRINK